MKNELDDLMSAQLMSAKEAAKEVDIPLLAIGQLMFEGLLAPAVGMDFLRKDVVALKSKQDVLERLR